MTNYFILRKTDLIIKESLIKTIYGLFHTPKDWNSNYLTFNKFKISNKYKDQLEYFNYFMEFSENFISSTHDKVLSFRPKDMPDTPLVNLAIEWKRRDKYRGLQNGQLKAIFYKIPTELGFPKKRGTIIYYFDLLNMEKGDLRYKINVLKHLMTGKSDNFAKVPNIVINPTHVRVFDPKNKQWRTKTSSLEFSDFIINPPIDYFSREAVGLGTLNWENHDILKGNLEVKLGVIQRENYTALINFFDNLDNILQKNRKILK